MSESHAISLFPHFTLSLRFSLCGPMCSPRLPFDVLLPATHFPLNSRRHIAPCEVRVETNAFFDEIPAFLCFDYFGAGDYQCRRNCSATWCQHQHRCLSSHLSHMFWLSYSAFVLAYC